MPKRKSFTQMKKDDMSLLDDLVTKSRKVVANERKMALHDLNQWLYRIRARYRRYRSYINPIANILGRAEHLKRVFLRTRPEAWIEEEEEEEEEW